MLDHILINPDNRLLSWSTQDFSLYGGQTPVDLQIGQARPAPDLPPAEARTADADIVSAVPEPAAASAVEPGTTVAEAQQSSETAHPPDVAPYPGFAFDLAAIQAPVFQTPGAPATVSMLSPTLSDGALHPAPSSESATSPSGAPAPAILSALDDTSGLVVTKVPLVTEAGAVVQDTIDFLTTPVDNLAHAVTPVAETVIGPVAETVIAPVVDAVEALASAPLDAATSGPLAETALPLIDDQVSDMLGADPAGGISTLVSLVSISDVFDVSDSGASDASAPILVPDLLDTLATDMPLGDALLGDTSHHEDNPLGDLPHADPLGLI
jgi:hypothetical protein